MIHHLSPPGESLVLAPRFGTPIEKALEIMGDDGINLHDLLSVGLVPDADLLAKTDNFSHVPWDEKTMAECRNDYFVLVPTVPIRLTQILMHDEILSRQYECPLTIAPQEWYKMHPFGNTSLKLGWHLIRTFPFLHDFDTSWKGIEQKVAEQGGIMVASAVLAMYTAFCFRLKNRLIRPHTQYSNLFTGPRTYYMRRCADVVKTDCHIRLSQTFYDGYNASLCVEYGFHDEHCDPGGAIVEMIPQTAPSATK